MSFEDYENDYENMEDAGFDDIEELDDDGYSRGGAPLYDDDDYDFGDEESDEDSYDYSE